MAGEKVEFDLQEFLTDMRDTLSEKIDGVDKKVAGMTARVDSHEIRLTLIETSRRTIKFWAATVISGGGIGVIISLWDYFTNHGGQ